MEQRTKEIKPPEIDTENIPELPEGFLIPEEEDVPSLKELVEQGTARIKEAEEAARQIRISGETRVEKVAGDIGVPPEEVEEAKKEMRFEEREAGITERIRALVTATTARIDSLFGEEPKEAQVVEESEEKEPFDQAEEYRKVQQIVESGASPAEKEKALREYKRELMTQKEGIARLQDGLRKSTEENPDISVEEMMALVEARAPGLRLTEKQKDFFREFAGAYQEKHQAIKNAREKYPEDVELFKACFGFEPRGEVNVEQGPMSFYFKCLNPEDFVDAFVSGRTFDEMKKKTLKRTLGGSKSFSMLPELRDALLIENSKKVSSRKSRSIHTHEKQHAFNRLFKEQHFRQDMMDDLLLARTDEEKEKAVLPYLRFEREGTLERTAKNELLAYFKQGDRPKKIAQHIRKEYNFFSAVKEHAGGVLRRARVKEEIAEKAIERVFGESEYNVILSKAAAAMSDLVKMGKPRDEIIELLTAEPIEQWPNLVRHLKQVKKGR